MPGKMRNLHNDDCPPLRKPDILPLKPWKRAIKNPDGKYYAEITGVDVLPDQKVRDGKRIITRDLLRVRFDTELGVTLYSRYRLDLKGYTPLHFLIKAALGEVKGPVSFSKLVNKYVTVEVSNKRVGAKIYANIIRVYPSSVPTSWTKRSALAVKIRLRMDRQGLRKPHNG